MSVVNFELWIWSGGDDGEGECCEECGGLHLSGIEDF
jgi:hypothetical protein